MGVVAHARLNPIPIVEADDPRLADFAGLRDPALRRAGLFVAETRLVVEQLLAQDHHRVRSVLVTDAACASLRGALDRCAAPPVVYVADVRVLERVAGYAFHRGCLAVAERGPERSADALLAGLGAGACLVLVLDEVSNPDNVGALFRTATAFGVRAVLLSPGSGDPLYRKTVRVSMGSTVRLPHARIAPWPDGLRVVREAGFFVVALTPGAGDVERFAAPAHGRMALLVGSEGSGLPPDTLALADAAVGIRMAPGVDSLNVAVAGAVALHRLARV